MFRILPLIALAAALPAHASILGDDIILDWGDGGGGAFAYGTVVDPGVEFADIGDELGFFSFQMDVDVTADHVRFDFTNDHYYYTDGLTHEPYTMYTLFDLDPICADGSPGTVTGMTNVTTNFDPLEWIPSQIAWDVDKVQITADPYGLNAEDETYIAAGTYIEFDIEYSCPAGPGGGGGTLVSDADGVEFDFGDGVGGCVLTEMVIPGYEWIDAGPDLCMAGPSGRLDSDVGADYWRIDFTAEQDFGTGGGVLIPLFTLGDLEPVCPDGSTGTINSLTSVTTNMDPLQWEPSEITFGPDYIQLLADPDDGANVRTHPGDFVEVEFDFSCGAGPSLTVGGSCPGLTPVDATGYTPYGQVAVLMSGGLGSATVPAGPCAGTATGLAVANFQFLINDWDGDGEFHFSPVAPGLFCGINVQFVDMTTCAVSAVGTF
ncbi:MAG: hypothetical protein ACI8PZ_002369 [Myxococcota bacterium]|jgi:hypothetical protein